MRRTTPVAAGLLLALAGPAGALELPSPEQQRAQDVALLREVGARADRVLVSVVPGPVVNDELVLVGLSGSGTPTRVVVEQRLQLTGTGDYQVRERGPARASEALGDEPPPVTKFGAVVWQGFSPGSRELAARLTLDPVLEAARLPLEVALSVDGQPLPPGGALPGPGTVQVSLTNATEQPAVLPTAADAPAAELAAGLDTARAAAASPSSARLPAAGAGLPATVGAAGEAQVQGVTGVPLRITGRLGASGAAASVTGPATSPDGTVAGTLPPGATAVLEVAVDGPGELLLDLTAVPSFDARTLEPPAGQPDWAAWAASGPDTAARAAALDLLVRTAATAARATSYSPYLGADLPGTGSTEFRYALAPPEQVEQVAAPLEPRLGTITLTGVLLLALLGCGVVLWSRA